MNKRNTAIANGELTYNSGKPCRAGHTTDRYASNGMCLACLKIQHEARSAVVKRNKIKRNTALFDSLRETKIMVRPLEFPIVQQLCDILQYSPSVIKEAVAQVIADFHMACPTPRALTRDTLVSVVGCVMVGTRLVNAADLDIVQDGQDAELYLVHNGHHYAAPDVMRVLRGDLLSVHPSAAPTDPVKAKL